MNENDGTTGSVSLRKLEANRRNALQSTGPRTAEGKAVSRMNAVTHGILAREVVLRGEHDGERRREFESLYGHYREHFAPVGPMEEMLVERIATAYWRLHRVLIAERGEIEHSVDGAHRRAEQVDPERAWLLVSSGDPESSTAGLWYLMHMLGKVRESVQREGELTDTALVRFARGFGGQPNAVTTGLQKVWVRAQSMREDRPAPEAFAGKSAPEVMAGKPAQEAVAAKPDEALKAERREVVLKFIDGELAWCEQKLTAVEEREKYEAQAHQEASFLPGRPALDRILRYEASLERQLYRAMNQLERLQRLRKGDNVPPPITMDVSGG
jgi:hypothetical protein